MRPLMLLPLIVFGLLAASGQEPPKQSPTPEPTKATPKKEKWQYHQLLIEDLVASGVIQNASNGNTHYAGQDIKLNALGRDGWELVNAHPVTIKGRDGKVTQGFKYFFKKRITE